MTRMLAALLTLVLALPAWAEVKVQDVTSPAGINAWLVEDHTIPFTALEIRFRGGTSLDPADKRGAVYLMTALIEEGAGDLDARAHARAVEALAASFRYDASDDAVSVSARFLTENRDEALTLLGDTIHEPRFDPEAIERVRAQVIASRESATKDPDDIARAALNKLIFGDHPYGSDGEGTVESVAALTREDILAAHAAVFARDRLYVSAVGDITPEELGAMLDDLLADLPETGAPLPDPAEVTIPGGVKVVDFDTPQSVAVFGQRGIERMDPDFFAAYVLNEVLGSGSFESRLMKEVREKRGLTYGVYSYLAPRDLAAVYLGSVASGNDRVAEAIKVIREEWAKAATDGISAEEVEAAKTYLTGAYPLRFDGNGPIARILTGMQMQGLPIDYIVTRNDKVNAVTVEDVNRVAAELLDPEGLQFVVVGRPVGLVESVN
ncbi:M16 family metallopeptidase [Sedimentitalea todarodis]|uniref:Pitrilysin family protein n=1 Tax=Sedimentitalea todarodis TaxID=1631240 RepID=A0ABU3VA32_9RHOB|nr:pitrilysin family protein [Sedimentitalea todarodis]MDU9003033.1 pitrilysin family protein [Sedimentitalea todarodis]